MTPSVRGLVKTQVVAILVVSASVTGALVGFAGGVAWLATGLPDAAPLVQAAIVVVAVLADVAYRRAGGPRPVCVGRQVPQAWSRLFGPRTVALLYGSRLGVGPLTILPSWLWWAAFVLGSLGGPWLGALAGAAFGAVRTVVMIAVAGWARSAMPRQMARLRRGEATAAVASAGAAIIGVAAVLGLGA